MTAITLKNITKIFTPDSHKGASLEAALKEVESGLSKSEILSATGCALALRNINLNIAEAERCAIMGLSGSGKSTLVRLINRLIDPTRGQILVKGEDVTNMASETLRHLRRHTVSMVFQSFALFPHKTVRENIAYGLTIQDKDENVIAEQSDKWINAVGLAGYDSARPHELSGGMRQRVGLARALAISPQILLMDEPFSALDPLTRSEMQDLLLSLAADLSITIIFITHDFNEALKIGQRIAILNEGEIVTDGTPREIVSNPRNNYTMQFVQNAQWPGHVVAKELMETPLPAIYPAENTLRVHENENLNSILSKIGSQLPQIVVVDDSDRPIGVIKSSVLRITPT